VNLSQSLVNLIVAQQAYQANAQTIKTQNAVVQTLLSL
jgi:Flagellar hook protein FlgE